MKILKVFIILILVPLVLGIFGEELFNSASGVLIPLLFSVSIVGSVLTMVINHKSGNKKISWYLIGSLFIVINLILLFLLVSFHPGF